MCVRAGPHLRRRCRASARRRRGRWCAARPRPAAAPSACSSSAAAAPPAHWRASPGAGRPPTVPPTAAAARAHGKPQASACSVCELECRLTSQQVAEGLLQREGAQHCNVYPLHSHYWVPVTHSSGKTHEALLRMRGRQLKAPDLSWSLVEGSRGAPASCWCSRCGSRCGSRAPARRCWCCRCSVAPPLQRARAAAADLSGTTASAATLRSASSHPVNLPVYCRPLASPGHHIRPNARYHPPHHGPSTHITSQGLCLWRQPEGEAEHEHRTAVCSRFIAHLMQRAPHPGPGKASDRCPGRPSALNALQASEPQRCRIQHWGRWPCCLWTLAMQMLKAGSMPAPGLLLRM